jgi:hypothetical protein
MARARLSGGRRQEAGGRRREEETWERAAERRFGATKYTSNHRTSIA